MKKISLISDTHNSLHPDLIKHLWSGDEIWHAGDIGSVGLLDSLKKIRPLRAVYGNIDNQDIRTVCPETQLFMCEDVKVMMTHIGGYPGKYEKQARESIIKEKPELFITGHSHILKVIYDKEYKLLHLNPGAAGRYGMHRVITMLQFTIDRSEIKDLMVVEFTRK